MKRKTKTDTQLFVNHLLEAVKHVECAQRSRGDEMMTHCMIRYGQILAFDRTLAAGSPVIEDELDCCPHTERLRMALERCQAEHRIVQEASSLFVRSGEFSAYVPLCDPAKLSIPVPDPPCAPLGDTFRAALMVSAALAKESAPTVLQSCVQLNPFSCIATNGSVIMEAWHGFDMPPGLLIPKVFADAVVKSRRHIVSFGFSTNMAPSTGGLPTCAGDATFTVHFDDKCWIRTNLYRQKIPSMLERLVPVEESHAFPEGFFAQVADIAKWSEDGRVYIDNLMISSHPPDKQQVGSSLSFPMPELLQGVSYSIASLKAIAKFATHYQDRAAKNVTMFFGNNLRGALAHETIAKTHEYCGERNGVCEGRCDGTCLEVYDAEQRRKAHLHQPCICGSGKTILQCDCIPF